MIIIKNETELEKISGGQPSSDTSGQYDIGYIIGYAITGLLYYGGFIAMNYPLAFK